jgi:hypothetical protein
MARGWESKSIEAQQEAAAAATSQPVAPVSAEESARRVRIVTLTLARTRAEADLRDATAPAHRAMLEEAIAHLNRQIAALGG